MFNNDEVMVAKIYEGNVKALKNYGYDGVKIDSCSEFLNMTRWSATMKAEGLTILTENCHNSDGQDPCMNSKVCVKPSLDPSSQTHQPHPSTPLSVAC
jgi:hypothetical protein